MSAAGLPLAGLRVLDMGTLTPGKYCTFLLADLGADVTRVERPGGVNELPLSDEDRVLNRNKRSIALDLKSALGAQALARLSARTDVLLEANRPGVADRLGYGYAALSTHNPALVYCSLTAFGQSGPYKDRAAYDLMFMGMSGVWQALVGAQAPPAAPGMYLADSVAGLTAAFGIVTACLQAQRTGTGAHLDLSMLEATSALLATSHGIARKSAGGDRRVVGPGSDPGSAPGYRCYKAQGDTYLVLGAIRPASWRALCEQIESGGLGDDPYATGAAGDAAIAALSDAFARAPASVWAERLTALDVDCAVVETPDAIYDNPQLLARQMVVTHTCAADDAQLSLISSPLAPALARAQSRPAPRPGADTEAVLRELGLT